VAQAGHDPERESGSVSRFCTGFLPYGHDDDSHTLPAAAVPGSGVVEYGESGTRVTAVDHVAVGHMAFGHTALGHMAHTVDAAHTADRPTVGAARPSRPYDRRGVNHLIRPLSKGYQPVDSEAVDGQSETCSTSAQPVTLRGNRRERSEEGGRE
jgi:hypothetical protein